MATATGQDEGELAVQNIERMVPTRGTRTRDTRFLSSGFREWGKLFLRRRTSRLGAAIGVGGMNYMLEFRYVQRRRTLPPV